MRKPLLFLMILLSLPLAASADDAIDVGTAIGSQPYHDSSDSPRILTGLEMLMRRNRLGLHVAGEYADTSAVGALVVLHVDAAYRQTLGQKGFILFGAGPTLVHADSFTGAGRVTWNAEAEIGGKWRRAEIFGRIRQFDFSIIEFRQPDGGPSGPAVYLGVRFSLLR